MKGKKLCKATAPPFKNKKLSKIVRTRAWLRKQVFEKSNKGKLAIYAQHRFIRNIRYCLSLSRKAKREFYRNINGKDVTDIKTLWKTTKPFLSDKTVTRNKITLSDTNLCLTEKKKVVQNYLNKINLNIPSHQLSSIYGY